MDMDLSTTESAWTCWKFYDVNYDLNAQDQQNTKTSPFIEEQSII